mmetsp:Transcript_5320/g.12701  ORF Transcript_5320/g.12701 Transcript_5320/m.12701 type:complete len:200 (+) Transcript_5320:2063-2662(+)
MAALTEKSVLLAGGPMLTLPSSLSCLAFLPPSILLLSSASRVESMVVSVSETVWRVMSALDTRFLPPSLEMSFGSDSDEVLDPSDAPEEGWFCKAVVSVADDPTLSCGLGDGGGGRGFPIMSMQRGSIALPTSVKLSATMLRLALYTISRAVAISSSSSSASPWCIRGPPWLALLGPPEEYPATTPSLLRDTAYARASF